MKSRNLKKFLASLGVAGLISAGGITVGNAIGSGWGGTKDSAVGADKKVEKPAGSGWGGQKDSTVSADNDTKDAVKEITDMATEKGGEVAEKAVDEAAGAAADAAKGLLKK